MVALITDADRVHMRRALELGEHGRGAVSPNPVVGAVVVRDGEVLGEGFHAALGERHAEVAALDDCRERGNDPAGAALYVTLEPCAHHGRKPPCVDRILAARIARVVIGADDPSEKASGRGPGMLRDGGVEVAFVTGAEASAARLANQAFRKHARTGRPLVVLKSAVSLDGRTATATGASKWISGAASRGLVHRWRAESDVVAIGIGTALADDPTLTARDLELPPIRQPRRVVFDSAARTPLDSRLVATIADAPLTVVAAETAPAQRVTALRGVGADVLQFSGAPTQPIPAALAELGRRDITSVLLEGGATLAGAFLDAGEVDEMRLFIAPVLLGDDARPLAIRPGAATMSAAERALSLEAESSGEDVLIRARLREW